MPFKSNAQRKKLWALKTQGKLPGVNLHEWAAKTKGKLPEHVEKESALTQPYIYGYTLGYMGKCADALSEPGRQQPTPAADTNTVTAMQNNSASSTIPPAGTHLKQDDKLELMSQTHPASPIPGNSTLPPNGAGEPHIGGEQL